MDIVLQTKDLMIFCIGISNYCYIVPVLLLGIIHMLLINPECFIIGMSE